jgi:oligosaccharide repeat unit polymerase
MTTATRKRSANNLLHVVLLGMVWGVGALVFADMSWLASIFLPLAYLTLVLAFVTTSRQWRDWINPLSIVLLLALVRFGIPGILRLLGPEPDTSLFRLMGLTDRDWLLGHALALLGLVGVVIGWRLPSQSIGAVLRGAARRANIRLTKGIAYSALIGMIVGMAALFAFVASNASLGAVVGSGEFRSTEIQVGTGVFFWLSLLLISASVTLTAYFVAMDRPWWIALVPVAICMVLFWTLGGRVRALLPVAAGLLLLWHRRGRPGFTIKGGVVLAVALLPIVLYAGQLYRGGQGLDGIAKAFSFDAVSGYVTDAIWVDWGQLYVLAGASTIGPAVLDGGTIFHTFLWPLSDYVFPITGKSAGVFMAERLVGFGDGRKWGFHSGLIGDAYLNFGFAGILIATVIFGVVLKRLYLGWKEGWVHGPLYVLSLLYALRIFFESIEKFTEGWIILLFAVLVIRAGQMTLRPARAVAPRPLAASRPSVSV